MTQKANHFSAKRYCHANTFTTPKAFANFSLRLERVNAEGVR